MSIDTYWPTQNGWDINRNVEIINPSTFLSRPLFVPQTWQEGTKRLTEKYGDVLVCVRFRYDAKLRQRLKTVELIVESADWTPPPPKYTADSMVPLRIEGYETELRAKAKAAGGRWNPEKQLWYVRYGQISGTILEKHIHIDESG